MDTHITHHAIDDHTANAHSAPVSARLPGEAGRSPHVDGAASFDPEVFGPPEADETIAGGPRSPGPGDRPPQSSEPDRPRRRHRLLLGVCAAALVCAAGGSFLVSPYNHILPVPGLTNEVRSLAASAGVRIPAPLLAPAASLASVNLSPPPPPPVREAYAARPRDQQVQEVLGLHRAAATAPTPTAQTAGPPAPVSAPAPSIPLAPAAPSVVPPAPAVAVDVQPPVVDLVVREPGSQAAPPPVPAPPPEIVASAPVAAPVVAPPSMPDVTGQVLASVNPPPAIPAPQLTPAMAPLSPPTPVVMPPPVPASAPGDTHDPVAAAAAAALRSGPVSSESLVEVLAHVTELSQIVKDLRQQDSALRSDLRLMSVETNKKLDDFALRLALAEARASMAAMRRDTPLVTPPSPGPAPSVAPLTGRPAPTASLPPTGVVASPVSRRFRVQAASPGLALLSEVDRGGGEGAQLQVAVGDTIPDLGKIKSITQRGTTWVVTAERGTVQ